MERREEGRERRGAGRGKERERRGRRGGGERGEGEAHLVVLSSRVDIEADSGEDLTREGSRVEQRHRRAIGKPRAHTKSETPWGKARGLALRKVWGRVKRSHVGAELGWVGVGES